MSILLTVLGSGSAFSFIQVPCYTRAPFIIQLAARVVWSVQDRWRYKTSSRDARCKSGIGTWQQVQELYLHVRDPVLDFRTTLPNLISCFSLCLLFRLGLDLCRRHRHCFPLCFGLSFQGCLGLPLCFGACLGFLLRLRFALGLCLSTLSLLLPIATDLMVSQWAAQHFPEWLWEDLSTCSACSI